MNARSFAFGVEIGLDSTKAVRLAYIHNDP